MCNIVSQSMAQQWTLLLVLCMPIGRVGALHEDIPNIDECDCKSLELTGQQPPVPGLTDEECIQYCAFYVFDTCDYVADTCGVGKIIHSYDFGARSRRYPNKCGESGHLTYDECTALQKRVANFQKHSTALNYIPIHNANPTRYAQTQMNRASGHTFTPNRGCYLVRLNNAQKFEFIFVDPEATQTVTGFVQVNSQFCATDPRPCGPCDNTTTTPSLKKTNGMYSLQTQAVIIGCIAFVVAVVTVVSIFV